MSLPSFPALVKRTVKGTPLTFEEGDGNLDKIQSYIEMLSSLFSDSLNPDGSLTDGSVDTEQLVDRSVTERKLDDISVFPSKEDTGATNSMRITFDPPLTTYGDGQVFFVKAANANTGPATLQVDSLAAIAIKKAGGVELALGDYSNGLIALAYLGGVFYLITGGSAAASSSSSDGFTGFKVFEPADAAIIADTTSQSFTHGLTATPNDFEVYLVNISTDLGKAAGDVIRAIEFTDGAGNPAFTVSANAAAVIVERNASAIELAGEGAIDTTKWNLRVRASLKTSVSAPLFPALSIVSRKPQGAFCDGNNLFVLQDGNTTAGATRAMRIDLATNNVTRMVIQVGAANPKSCSGSPIVKADGTKHVLFMSTLGLYDLELLESDPWNITRLASNVLDLRTHKVVHFTESAGTITNVWCLTGTYNSFFNLTNIPLRTFATSGGPRSDVGIVLNLTNVAILDPDGIAGNSEFIAYHPSPSNIKPVLLQYNRIKKRLYVMTDENNLLFIFEIDDTGFADPGSFLEWWNLGSSRYAVLQHVKTLALGGDGSTSNNGEAESYYVEHDLVNGEERSIIFCRTGNANNAGSVTRIPWRE
jgi:hypothetical protein